MEVNLLERNLTRKSFAQHHHPSNPEKYNIGACFKETCRIVAFVVVGFICRSHISCGLARRSFSVGGPPQGRERPKTRGKQSIQDILVLFHFAIPTNRADLWFF